MTTAHNKRGSLRTPILRAVLIANLVTFAVLIALSHRAAARDRTILEKDYKLQLSQHLEDVVDPLGRIRPRTLLRWRGWRWYEDAIVAQNPRRSPDGRLLVDGVYLNPLGRAHRPIGFDDQSALEMIRTAIERGEVVESPDGYAAPIGRPASGTWGGAWFRQIPIALGEPPTQTLLPLFFAILLATTLFLLILLRRTVIEPIDELAGAAGRLSSGDLSARVAAPATPGARADELTALGSTFNAMAKRLERYNSELESAVAEATERVRSAEAAAMTQRRLAATGELAAGIAHELNNPLGGLVNAVESLKRPDLPAERRAAYLDLVSGGLGRMGETVGRLLRLSPREATLDEVEIARPLGDALGLVRHRAEMAGVAIELLGPAGAPRRDAFSPDAMTPLSAIPPIRGAANELGQAFLNLAVNAIDAIEGDRSSGGTLTISLDTAANSRRELVVIVFEDDGPGISEELIARVADPFFTTKEQGKGTGLGLAIVHNITSAHDGRVLLEGREGQGLRVTIELPIAVQSMDQKG